MTAYTEDAHALQPHCPPETIVGSTRCLLNIVKVKDGYEFEEYDPKTGIEHSEHFATYEGRRAAQFGAAL